MTLVKKSGIRRTAPEAAMKHSALRRAEKRTKASQSAK
jgi:hypothetical protein